MLKPGDDDAVVRFAEDRRRRPTHFGDPNRFRRDLAFLERVGKLRDFLFEAANRPLGRQAAAIGVNVDYVEKLARARVERRFEVIDRNAREPAVKNDEFRVDRFDRLVRFAKKRRVIGAARFRLPKAFEVRLVPNFPIADSVAVTLDRSADVLEPSVQMLERRGRPSDVVIENRQDLQPDASRFVDDAVEMVERPFALFPLDAAPREVGARPSDSGRLHQFEVLRHLIVFFAAAEVRADAVRRVGDARFRRGRLRSERGVGVKMGERGRRGERFRSENRGSEERALRKSAASDFFLAHRRFFRTLKRAKRTEREPAKARF